MIRRLTKVQLALFLAITVVATSILSASYVGLTERLFGTGPTVVADLASSGGIFAGAEVTYRGVRVGRVSELTLSADGVRVHAKLESGSEVPVDTRAVVENRSAVGEQYLDLQPRSQGGPYLADGDVIKRADTATPLRVDQLLLDVDHTVRSVPQDDLVTVIDELGTGFEGTGDDLGRLIDNGDALTRSAIDALPDTIALLKSGKTVLDTQRVGASQITTFSGNLARISETLKASDPDLRVVLDRGTVASKELEAVVRENRDSLGTLVANLVTVGQVTSSRVDGIDQLLITYPEVVAGGYTVVPGDGTAHFGVQLTQAPAPCTAGYGGTTRTDPNRTSGLPPVNTAARCSLPRGSASDVRGAQNAPGARPVGSASYAMAYGSDPVPLGTTAYGAPLTVSAPVAPQGSGSGAWSWIMEEAAR
ncbi:MlaD family protein [Phycicoccus sp.]|uniref:MlaD family protein n=1 Tax=Phycicoccus sp. TaxID=1902410 RepID=UPI002BB867BA|nr:MlaD family protein [Phycicoccus sp.]HMM97226.1 MlaD family protein [Phycicoccus sp.]